MMTWTPQHSSVRPPSIAAGVVEAVEAAVASVALAVAMNAPPARSLGLLGLPRRYLLPQRPLPTCAVLFPLPPSAPLTRPR